ncbi:MAG: hypothetical protein EOP51_02555 [Sphingobacteriales bacterium]|nr:MAG: hypothetical protein EOP51_02555 [Sphingobacteriales bacterium]
MRKLKNVLGLATVVSMLSVALFGCKETNNAPDVTEVKVQLHTQRLDQDIANIDTANISAGIQQVRAKYPDFLEFYLDTLIGMGINGNYTAENPAISTGLRSFLTHKDYRGLFDTVAKHYPDTKDIDAQLVKSFQYAKHYEPDFKEPHVIYMITWLNKWAAFTYDSTLGICLDMFLGPNYPIYKAVDIPKYLAVQLDRNYIPVASMKAIYRDKHPFILEDRTLLDMMIQKGKEAYYLENVLPFLPEALRLGYTEDQLKWCYANEALVYNFFIRENFLYERNQQKVMRYVIESQSSTGMPEQSPGNIGTWLGLQIIHSYLLANPKTTFQELLNSNMDAQKFLQASKYKPKG